MLAAIYRSTGGSEVLSVEEVPTPAPGPGEVRVRLRVAGVNPTDWKMRTSAEPLGDFGKAQAFFSDSRKLFVVCFGVHRP